MVEDRTNHIVYLFLEAERSARRGSSGRHSVDDRTGKEPTVQKLIRNLNQLPPPLERRRVVVSGRAQSCWAEGFLRQLLKRLENCAHRDDGRLTMKSQPVTAVLVVGCGESQQSAPPVEAKPEPPTAKAPDISIHIAARDGNIEAVKQHLAAGADVNVKDRIGGKTTARMGKIKDQYLVRIFEHELGQVPILSLPWRIASPIFQ